MESRCNLVCFFDSVLWRELVVSLKRNLHHPMILDDAKKYYIFILLIIYHFVKAYNIFGLNYANHTDMVICQVFENFTSAKNVLREKDHDFCDKFQVWCHCRPLGPSFRIITILHEGRGGNCITKLQKENGL